MSNIIGKVIPRIDAINLATGKTQFCADKTIEGMLFAKTCRSKEVYAQILSIDTSKAKALPGVVAVATAEDIPGLNLHGIHILDQAVLVPVGGMVRLVGEPIAIVAAESIQLAEQAVELIQAEYRKLEPITDFEAACLDGSEQIHKDMKFAKEYCYNAGDINKGFFEADIIVEHTQYMPRQEHAYLETEAGIAYYDYDGMLTVYSQSQEPFGIRHQVARSLNLPVGKVRAIVPPVGGAFGGKQSMTVHIHIALLTYMTKRPVQMVWTREESLLMSTKKHPAIYRCKLGAKNNGLFTAFSVDYLLDAGAYTEHSPGVTMCAGQTAVGPYHIPNIEVMGRAVYTNNPISGAFRGYGGPQSTCAIERTIHKLAKQLNLDQAEIRRKNSLKIGDKPGNREMVIDSKVTLIETINNVIAASGKKPEPSSKYKKTGRGIACSIPQFDVSAKPYNGLTGAGAEVELFFDGTVQIRSGIVEMGTGIRTALAQIVSQELSIDINKIEVILSDTAITPKAGPTVASRSMYCVGNAVKQATEQLKQRICDRAGIIFNVPSYCIEVKNERVFLKGMESKGFSLKEFAVSAFITGTNLVSYIYFKGVHAKLGHTYVSTLADVEVDEETGQVEILFIATSHDAGKIINPLSVKGQLVGGAVMGQGWALMENMQSLGGKILNRTLAEYLIPTSLDIPRKTEVISVEDPYPTGPYGAKGVGEHSMYTIAPAILNAIEDAVGIDLNTFPATPEVVWRALQEQGERKANRSENKYAK